MSNYVRTQILIDKNQRIELNQIAKKTGKTLSEIVRDFLDAQILLQKYENMKQAADELKFDYSDDSELTALSSLDGEDFSNE